ncbi:MAG TPA: diadenylate cyclase CdaA [Anaerolineaceae bacterium]|nr:diadenylate cyclase CdaA [Anaerolineaceae bacterium]HOV05918.1 diadenylate cyclase CdaA [Anaerolineaceae bacterium]
MSDLWSEIVYIFQRMNWLSLVDVFLVASVVFAILMLLRDTQIMVLLRGVIVISIFLVLLTTFINLPAFSWLVSTMVPALLFAIPVIFAPEIRRGLEKLGRAGSSQLLVRKSESQQQLMEKTIRAIVTAASRLSAREHGALIVLQRADNLEEYARTGVRLNADVTPELLLQIFYPNTPLHDGAVIIANNQVIAGACVMPLSSSGILTRSPERQMGLRHRAALGTSEATDAITVVVSEETGSISIAHNGRMIRRLDSERLENILLAFYQPPENPVFKLKPWDWLKQILPESKREE